MKKKLFTVLCVISLIVGLIGCGKSASNTTDSLIEDDKTEALIDTGSYQVALVMDLGILNDKSFNQGSWEGMQQYCDENNLTYKYYKSKDADAASFQMTIEEAISSGAEVVVCPGFSFEVPVYNLQTKYPDVKFILIDGEPHNEDYSVYTTASNTMAVLFQEDQAGFLAGYAAVKDGSTSLGFMGGIDLPAVIHYGYGFLEGAEYAASEDNVSVNVNYTYTGSFDASDEAEAMATDWYNGGTQVIFGCGGLVGNSVMLAAENSESGKVIGVDVDQSQESITVVTSAMKMLSNAVYDALADVYDGSFVGGKATTFNINNDGVGIAMDTARFTSFTQDDYDVVYNKLVSGEITTADNFDMNVSELNLEHVTVTPVEFK